MPWLNYVDADWLAEVLKGCQELYVIEDHAPVGGLGDRLLNVIASEGLLQKIKFHCIGIDGFPACGTPAEVLKFHGLDGKTLANRIAIK